MKKSIISAMILSISLCYCSISFASDSDLAKSNTMQPQARFTPGRIQLSTPTKKQKQKSHKHKPKPIEVPTTPDIAIPGRPNPGLK